MYFTGWKEVLSLADEGRYLWVGTQGGGLVRLDKTTGQFIIYNSRNSALPSNDVTAIVIDGSGSKWIGTDGGGLAKFDGLNWTVYGLRENYVRAIAIDGSGNKWIGTWGGGVAKFDGTEWTEYLPSNSGLPDEHVTAIAIDPSGNKWIGTYGRGLAKFDGTNWTVYNTSNSALRSNFIGAIAIDASGNKWIGTTYGGGLAMFDDTNWTVYMPGSEVSAITIDGSGNKWIGTWGALAKFDGTKWTLYNTSNSGLPDNRVAAIAIDGSSNVWVGTPGGLANFDGTHWTVYTVLPDNWIGAIAIDGQGNKWIGTGGGLAKFDGTKWTVYNTSNSALPSNVVVAISIDGSSNKWIGTWGGGLACLRRDATWTVYDTSNSGLPSNYVSAIAIDRSGSKWIGTRPSWSASGHEVGGGLAKFDGTNWTVYNASNSGLPSNWVNAVAIDGSGNQWIGTWSGLAKFDGANWTVYNKANSGLPDNYVGAIAVDAYGHEWIGAYSWWDSKSVSAGAGGLAKFDGQNWTVYNRSNSPLPSNDIAEIAIDGSGNKWIGMLGYWTDSDWASGGLARLGDKFENWGSRASAAVLTSSQMATSDATNCASRALIFSLFYWGWPTFETTTWAIWPSDGVTAIAIDGMGNKWLGIWSKGLAVYHEGGVTLGDEGKQNKQTLAPVALLQNYPNPFNPLTTISYQLPVSSDVTLKVYDILGREVATLVNGHQNAGTHSVTFDASNLPSGVYLCRMVAGNFSEVRKMVVIR